MTHAPSDDDQSADTLSLPFIFVPDGDPPPTAWLARHPEAIRLRATFVPHRSNLPPGGTQMRQRFDPIAALARTGRGLEQDDPIEAYRGVNDAMIRMGFRFADGPGSSFAPDDQTPPDGAAQQPWQIAQATQPTLLPGAAGNGRTQHAYVDPDPQRWSGHSSVGSGECVPLVQQATGAPRTAEWRRGEQVKGNPDIAPGTAIATFDSNGRYGNHIDGTSHAAIYLGQGPEGIYVIDQWNESRSGGIRTPRNPKTRTIFFDSPKRLLVDQGEF